MFDNDDSEGEDGADGDAVARFSFAVSRDKKNHL